MDRFGFHPQSYLKQPTEAQNGFIYFMLDQTQGFTHAGVERLNDSIRTYVWAILGAQDEERAPILGSGTAFTAQKRFLQAGSVRENVCNNSKKRKKSCFFEI